MQRITVSVPDQIADLARADVEAGFAPSLSAWVAAAMRDKAQARIELQADLARMEAENPTTTDDIAELAAILDRSEDWVREALGRPGVSPEGPARAKQKRSTRSVA